MSGLGGARIALLEARMGGELAGLVRRHGGEPVCAPAVREAAVACAAEVGALIDALAAGAVRVVVFLTGVGVHGLLQAAEGLGRRPELLSALGGATTVCRGPKPVAALKASGIVASLNARAPFTTAELLEALAGMDLSGQGVAVVHYGERNDQVAELLRARAARVVELCLYEWLLPEDVAPLHVLVDRILAGDVEVVAFTSQVQARHLFAVAAQRGQADALAQALRQRAVVAAVGPTCAAALEALGIRPDVVPSHPKMGHLVLALARYLGERGRDPVAAAPDPLAVDALAS